jgi:hypothetical protein
MRTERASTRRLRAVLAVALLVGCVGCGSRVDTSTSSSSSTASTATTATTSTTEAPAGTTSTSPPSTSATTIAPTTPPSTKTSVLRSVPPETKNFCDYIQSVTLSDIPDADWTAGYHRVQEALVKAKELAPPAIKQAVTDLSGAVDSLKPEVEAKKVTSNAELDAWFAKQDTATKTKVLTAGKQIQIFYDGNCG